MQNLSHSSSYSFTVRSAHNLAELLKRVRPDLRIQAEELQLIVRHSHGELEELAQRDEVGASLSEGAGRVLSPNPASEGEIANAITNLEAAYQALCDLKHADKPALCEIV